MINMFGKPEFIADNTIIKPYQEKLVDLGKLEEESRNKIRAQMKLELNEF